MTMPKNLVLVRHGESEGNKANRLSRSGDNSRFLNQEFLNRPESQWRLTELGVEQAIEAGNTLQQLGICGDLIGRNYSSPYVRALETMAHVVERINGPNIFIAPELSERSWGNMVGIPHDRRQTLFFEDLRKLVKDPLNQRPDGGENFWEVRVRIRSFLDTLRRKSSDMEYVVACCHEEVMKTFRITIERLNHETYLEMTNDKTQGIWNGGIIQYTRINPQDQDDVRDNLSWVRLINLPYAKENGALGFDWKEIVRPSFTPDEIFRYIDELAPKIKFE